MYIKEIDSNLLFELCEVLHPDSFHNLCRELIIFWFRSMHPYWDDYREHCIEMRDEDRVFLKCTRCHHNQIYDSKCDLARAEAILVWSYIEEAINNN
ncbi:hypothetical protein LCGC14_1457880 [marine sediment metagenome]|uniref:Uncharacterized protein n=1 Tax=marine sediment metagenome TaxID=412755 RepID=A0A0F9LWI6_9ZZZZ